MNYRRLGKSGLEVSELSLGSWVTFGDQIKDDIAQSIMKTAYDHGVNFFDNAESYSAGKSEIVMGRILKKMGWKRDHLVLSSKVYWGGEGPNKIGLNRKRITEACHGALKRLQVEYLDLFYCHRPDKFTPIEEVVWSMNILIRQGKVLYWGTSEWSAQQIMEAYAFARQSNLIPPAMEQPHYNMLNREKVEGEFRRLYSTIGLGLTTYSPLRSGFLTGKYLNGIPENSRLNLPGYDWLREGLFGKNLEKNNEKVKLLIELARELDTTITKFALAWCLKNPNISSVITGASKIEQVFDNMKALKIVPLLTEEIMEKIESILKNKPDVPQF